MKRACRRSCAIARTLDPATDLRARIAAGYALGDPRFTRQRGPYGDYLPPPMVTIPADTYTIGSDKGIAPSLLRSPSRNSR